MTIPIPGTRYITLAKDGEITRKCLRQRTLTWDRDLLAIPAVAKVLKPGSVVLDIGAFIGDTTRLFIDAGCTVLAFEPQADAFACLKHNCPEAKLFNAAVGNGVAVTLETGKESNLGSRQVHEGSGTQTVSIDDLQLPRVDFVKLDVEGFEPWVLDGMLSTIARCRPLMFVEVNDAALAEHGMLREDISRRLPDYTLQAFRPNHTPFDWLCVPRV